MILSCLEDQYGRLHTLNVKICPLYEILWTEEGGWQLRVATDGGE